MATLVAADDATAVGTAELIDYFIGFAVKSLEAVAFFAAASPIARAVTTCAAGSRVITRSGDPGWRERTIETFDPTFDLALFTDVLTGGRIRAFTSCYLTYLASNANINTA